MAKIRQRLAERVRELRGKSTQIVFAKKLGITQSSLNRIEQQQQNVTIDTIERICKRLKCKPSDLLD